MTQGKKVNAPNLMWTPAEIDIVLIALAALIGDIENVDLGKFKADAKTVLFNTLLTAKSAKQKLENFTTGGRSYTLPTYREGDEKQFLDPKP